MNRIKRRQRKKERKRRKAMREQDEEILSRIRPPLVQHINGVEFCDLENVQDEELEIPPEPSDIKVDIVDLEQAYYMKQMHQTGSNINIPQNDKLLHRNRDSGGGNSDDDDDNNNNHIVTSDVTDKRNTKQPDS